MSHLSPKAIALQGIGFSALLVALQGFSPAIIPVEPVGLVGTSNPSVELVTSSPVFSVESTFVFPLVSCAPCVLEGVSSPAGTLAASDMQTGAGTGTFSRLIATSTLVPEGGNSNLNIVNAQSSMRVAEAGSNLNLS